MRVQPPLGFQIHEKPEVEKTDFFRVRDDFEQNFDSRKKFSMRVWILRYYAHPSMIHAKHKYEVKSELSQHE